MREELGRLPELLSAHLALTLFPLLAGLCLALGLGLAAHRSPWIERVALGAAGVVQTVPSLALLALMVALLGAFGQKSIGFLPAFAALVLYSLLPILRNTVVGLGSVDPAVLEAARGVGMNERQRLVRVELPLALPVIVAGVRTAAVWTVGAATLATPVGADSLGNFIFAGLQTRNVGALVLGCAASAALALFLDGLGRVLFTGLTKRDKRLTLGALAVFAVLYLYAGIALARAGSSGTGGRVTVGSKTFTEQYILSHALCRAVERAGAGCELKQSLGSSLGFDALARGALDLYVDYSGTIWTTVMKRREFPPDRRLMLDDIRQFLSSRYDIVVVAALGFENGYALALRRDLAVRLGASRISDLAHAAPRLSIAGDYEFFARPEWKAVASTYGLAFRMQTAMDGSLMYQAAHDGAVDVIAAFSTDGRLSALDLVVLEDDRRAVPPYDALLLASGKMAREHPGLLQGLRSMSGAIDAQLMRRMNFEVDGRGRSPAAVGRELAAVTKMEARARELQR